MLQSCKRQLNYCTFPTCRSANIHLACAAAIQGIWLRNNARYYDPGIGRFVSADTIVPGAGSLTVAPNDAVATKAWRATGAAQNPQDLNRYSYGSNNPAKNTDPTGHCAGVASHFDGSCRQKATHIYYEADNATAVDRVTAGAYLFLSNGLVALGTMAAAPAIEAIGTAAVTRIATEAVGPSGSPRTVVNVNQAVGTLHKGGSVHQAMVQKDIVSAEITGSTTIGNNLGGMSKGITAGGNAINSRLTSNVGIELGGDAVHSVLNAPRIVVSSLRYCEVMCDELIVTGANVGNRISRRQ